ncbi:cation transporter [Paenibacillus sp. HN-1]|uniref:cation diffusion facilitator family transporter n=1 Tax=Paenibacillus TaxID=44249 RepID=UPI001CA9C8B1|nr:MULTISPECIES: cation diffusion facilitator family transporter [Paenibacillus]MBY9078099.1 cation transporter [Paenibacillus sp. CGMCC 1.18879]MBY9083840.1 cation transporter [Paenibacillus sinensis]
MNKTGRSAGEQAIWISIISNMLLTILKIAVGTLAGSQVLIADGVHNAGDVIATVAALASTKVANRPKDESHMYGHGKAEVIGSAIVAVIMILAAVFIAYHAVVSLFHPAAEPSLIALIAAAISLIWKQWLYVYCIRLGRTTKSKSLQATAHDHLADVYASIAAVVGIGLALIGSRYDIAVLSYGDPVAGIIVSYFVLRLAFHMGKDAIDILMEKSVSVEQIREYEALILTIPEVKRIDRLRAREFGQYVMLDVRVGIPAQLTIQEGHDIIRKIKAAIIQEHADVEEVLVHLNPWYENEGPAGTK